MPSVEELKIRFKNLQAEKKWLNNELKSLKLKLEFKMNPDQRKMLHQETKPQLKELVAFK